MRLFGLPVCLSAAACPALAALSALVLPAPKAHAQATFLFTGSSGTQRTATLTAPVTYTLTSDLTTRPLFVFVGANAANTNFSPFEGSGTLTYTVNGTTRTVNTLRSGYTGNQIAATDVFVADTTSIETFFAGTVFTLNAGTFTSTFGVTGTRPANGTFTTFIADNFGIRSSSNGVSGPAAAAPEPGTVSLIGIGLVSGMGTLGVARKRRKNAAV